MSPRVRPVSSMPAGGPLTPDLVRLESVVAPDVINALATASAELQRLGIRHLVVGALAVGMYGAPRATPDVDLLVGPEAYEHYSVRRREFTCFVPGVPVLVDGVRIDLYPGDGGGGGAFADQVRAQETLRHTIPVALPEEVVLQKLRLWRTKDKRDVEALLRLHPGLPAWIEDALARHPERGVPLRTRYLDARRAVGL